MKSLLSCPVYRKYKKSLLFRIDPSNIRLYGLPYNNLLENYSSEKNYFLKLKLYLQYKRSPFVIQRDQNIEKIELEEDISRYHFVNQLYSENYNYKKTLRYKNFCSLLESGKEVKKKNLYLIRSKEELRSYFQIYEDLIKNIDKYGYDENIVQDDISVWIDEYGKLIKGIAGRHRFAAARVTKRIVPVRVRYIHIGWIEEITGRTYSSVSEIGKEEYELVIRDIKNRYCID